MTYYNPTADWSLIPQHMRGAVERYVMNGLPPGGFLTPVLCNDFMEACGRADAENAMALVEWATFIYNFVPAQCKGSPKVVEAWIKAGGLNGLVAAAEQSYNQESSHEQT